MTGGGSVHIEPGFLCLPGYCWCSPVKQKTITWAGIAACLARRDWASQVEMRPARGKKNGEKGKTQVGKLHLKKPQ